MNILKTLVATTALALTATAASAADGKITIADLTWTGADAIGAVPTVRTNAAIAAKKCLLSMLKLIVRFNFRILSLCHQQSGLSRSHLSTR